VKNMSELNFKPFSDQDDNAIKKALKRCNGPWEALSKDLGKPDYVIIQRAFQLGLVPFNKYNHVLLSHRTDGWRCDEIDFLIEYAGKVSAKVLANRLGRSDASVAKQIYEFKLSRNQDPSWKSKELRVLQLEINEGGAGHVAKITDRCLIDVKHQAIKQGWCKRGVVLTLFTGRPRNVKLQESLA